MPYWIQLAMGIALGILAFREVKRIGEDKIRKREEEAEEWK